MLAVTLACCNINNNNNNSERCATCSNAPAWTHFTALPHLFIQLWQSVILACFSQRFLQKRTSYEGQTQKHAYVGSRFSTLCSYKYCASAGIVPPRASCQINNAEAGSSPVWPDRVYRAAQVPDFPPAPPPPLTLSLSLSVALSFFSLILSLINKEKNNPNQQHTNTHPPSLSVSAERISCPSAVFTGSPGVKTNTGHGLKERAAWEGGVCTWTPHGLSAPICSESANES